MNMQIEKYILAAITTDERKVNGCVVSFICENQEELENVASDLEAILDGIAHRLSNDVYVIVKH